MSAVTSNSYTQLERTLKARLGLLSHLHGRWLFAAVWSRATEASLGRSKHLSVTTEAKLEYTRLTRKEE